MAERHRATLTAAAAALLSSLFVLALFAGSASAAFIHKTGYSERFGSEGTTGSTLTEEGSLAIDQARQRLYAANSSSNETHVRAFELPAHTPASSPFPLEVNASGSLSVDQTSGNLFLQSFFVGIFGWNSSGTSLNPALYPIPPSIHEDQCYGAVDPNGNLWVSDTGRDQVEEINTTTGNVMQTLSVKGATNRPCLLAFDESNGDLFVGGEGGFGPGGLFRFTAASGYHAVNTVLPAGTFQVSGVAVDPNSHLVYAAGVKTPSFAKSLIGVTATGGKVEEVQNPPTGGSGNTYGGLQIDDQTGALYAGYTSQIYVFPAQIIPTVTAAGPSDVAASSLVANGHVDPAGGAAATECYVEWGLTLAYGEPHVPCSQSTPISASEDVSAELTGLAPGQTYHYRFVAVNAEGKGLSADRTVLTAGKPSLEGVYASGVTATGALLHGKVDPEALETTYWFEYGPSPEYGTKVPIAGGTLAPAQEMQPVSESVSGLNGGVYHFRLVAENSSGKVVSEDQTFNFYAQPCPNEIVRQETGSEYLPDCRAYELVSPGAAGNVIFVPEHAQPGPLATSPSRFAFGGELGGVTGTEPLNSLNVDTYVATRTSSGWTTALVGLKGSEALGATLTLGDQNFDEFMDFNSSGGFAGTPQPEHNLPYIWGPDGSYRGRWPLTTSLIPGADETKGTFQASPDFSHLAFSSINVPFTPNGLIEPPGSVYDYNTKTGSTELISLLPGGGHVDIPEPLGAKETHQFLIFPSSQPFLAGYPELWQPVKMHQSISTDGSHILMAASDGQWISFGEPSEEPPTYLYMRVDDAITYDVGQGHAVKYVGMTPDGSKVFFTSDQQLTGEDTDHSVDLYMWTEANEGEIKLISKGEPGTGNGEECHADWTEGCDALPVEGAYETDNSIAEETGEIYFYSPEILQGTEATQGGQNLYRYHNGSVTYVASFPNHEKYCPAESCSNGPVGRIQISPDGAHVALLTNAQLTPYKNNEFEEMYTYDPSTQKINCVSCMPNGEPPTGEVSASLQGLFMSNDGRTFFYTPDPLTPKDTNEVEDVYEFTNGRPQLITSGTTSTVTQSSNFHTRAAGFEGVSANGLDAYFSTFETLVGQDQNGEYLKFYDARTGGGFPYVPPAAPCEAADECHGEGSSPPSPAGIVSGDQLGSGGNVPTAPQAKKKPEKKSKKKSSKEKAKKNKHARASRRHTHGHGGNRHA